MRRIARTVTALVAGIGLGALPITAKAENLAQAWDLALSVNQRLQAQQLQSAAAGLDVQAARAARLPAVRTTTQDLLLSNSPTIRPGVGSGSAGAGAPGAGVPTQFGFLGPGQTNVPFSLTSATLPLYTSGRIRRNIDAANHQLGARRAQEFRAVLDLRLTVAQAYIGVLRARRNLAVARTNIEQLTSFLRDVKNRQAEGLAIRSDELAAEVSLSTARQAEVRARTSLASAWSTYNRYLGRPMNQVVELDELTPAPHAGDWQALAAQAVRAHAAFASLDERQVNELIQHAWHVRPELADLTEQARSLNAQADATRAAVRPQVGVVGAFVYLGANNLAPQGFGVAAFYLDWTIFDGQGARRRAESLRMQEHAAMAQRCDQAAEIALEVRKRWLELQQAREISVETRVAVAQSEENIRVITERYRQGLSTYTEVLDAESRRVQSLTADYNAHYDEGLALFELKRSVGDL
jgi:outer membrane protein TolC